VKPAPFEYHAPASLEEALSLLADHEDAVPLSGNQSLGILMSNRMATPDHLVDLGRIDELADIDIMRTELVQFFEGDERVEQPLRSYEEVRADKMRRLRERLMKAIA